MGIRVAFFVVTLLCINVALSQEGVQADPGEERGKLQHDDRPSVHGVVDDVGNKEAAQDDTSDMLSEVNSEKENGDENIGSLSEVDKPDTLTVDVQTGDTLGQINGDDEVGVVPQNGDVLGKDDESETSTGEDQNGDVSNQVDVNVPSDAEEQIGNSLGHVEEEVAVGGGTTPYEEQNVVDEEQSGGGFGQDDETEANVAEEQIGDALRQVNEEDAFAVNDQNEVRLSHTDGEDVPSTDDQSGDTLGQFSEHEPPVVKEEHWNVVEHVDEGETTTVEEQIGDVVEQVDEDGTTTVEEQIGDVVEQVDEGEATTVEEQIGDVVEQVDEGEATTVEEQIGDVVEQVDEGETTTVEKQIGDVVEQVHEGVTSTVEDQNGTPLEKVDEGEATLVKEQTIVDKEQNKDVMDHIDEDDVTKVGDQNEDIAGERESSPEPIREGVLHQNEMESLDEDVIEMPRGTQRNNKLPNIVIIIADDVGMGDIGCFGNDTIRTPNIDSIAARGAKLTQHLTAAAVCTPSRAALMTGRYPIRSGMATNNVMSVIGHVSGRGGLPPEEVTIAELVKRQGYKTALIGKWHLGLNCDYLGDNCHHPNNQGFDFFYGTPLSNFQDLGRKGLRSMAWSVLPHLQGFQRIVITVAVCVFGALLLWATGTIRVPCCFVMVLVPLIPFLLFCLVMDNVRIWNSVLMRDFEVVEQQFELENMSSRLVHEGVEFLEARHNDQQPFLLFMSWLQCHTALHASKDFKGKSAHGGYGDGVEEMDWSTGQILQSLENLGFTDNTLVYFSSDNGGHFEHYEFGERAGGHNGIYRGGKSQGGQEGGIRVPTVAMWPGRIPPNTVIDVPTSQMDILPTLANIIGVEPPSDRVIDGQDILPVLQGIRTHSPHEFMFHYCGIWLHAARWSPSDSTDVWKVIYAMPNWLPGTEHCGNFACTCMDVHTWLESPLLYNIATDPSETRPLDITLPMYKDIVTAINEAKRKHEETVVPVPNQLGFLTSMFRPWLQPYCNFPYFNCKDPKYVNT